MLLQQLEAAKFYHWKLRAAKMQTLSFWGLPVCSVKTNLASWWLSVFSDILHTWFCCASFYSGNINRFWYSWDLCRGNINRFWYSRDLFTHTLQGCFIYIDMQAVTVDSCATFNHILQGYFTVIFSTEATRGIRIKLTSAKQQQNANNVQ